VFGLLALDSHEMGLGERLHGAEWNTEWRRLVAWFWLRCILL
jgi:hypothetical protein